MARTNGLVGAALLCVACGGGSTTPDAAVYGGDFTYTVKHYDVDLDLGAAHANTTVTLVTTSPGQCLTIGFRPDAADVVALAGAPAASVQIDAAGDTLHACDAAGHGWPEGTELTLIVSAGVPQTTLATSDVGFSTHTDRDGASFRYLVSWVGGCDRHGPCDAAPDRFATYTFTVHHDASTQVLCSGKVTPGPATTVCDFTYDGGPTYSTFAVLARTPAWTESAVGTWGGVGVSLYDEPSSQIAATLEADQIKAHFEWLQQTFGPYPYGDELRLVTAPTYWAGFEHPGNIALSELLATSGSSYADGLTHTVMHEIAHQWAGDHATLKDTYDFVWKESMAEYLSYVSEDERVDAATAQKTAKAWKSFASGSRYYLVPEEKPELFDYYGDVYGPGPMILFRQLEVMYGRDKVITALQALIGQPQARTLSVDDVRAALEASTGADLSAYFDAWVKGTGTPSWPTISTNLTDPMGAPCAAAGMCTLAVSSQTADGVPRGAAFTVRIHGAQPTDVLDVKVGNGVAGGPYPPVDVNLPFAPTSVEIDPNAEALVFPATTPKPSGAPRKIEPWRVR